MKHSIRKSGPAASYIRCVGRDTSIYLATMIDYEGQSKLMIMVFGEQFEQVEVIQRPNSTVNFAQPIEEKPKTKRKSK